MRHCPTSSTGLSCPVPASPGVAFRFPLDEMKRSHKVPTSSNQGGKEWKLSSQNSDALPSGYMCCRSLRDRKILKNCGRCQGPPSTSGLCVSSSGRTRAVHRLQRPGYSGPPLHLLPCQGSRVSKSTSLNPPPLQSQIRKGCICKSQASGGVGHSAHMGQCLEPRSFSAPALHVREECQPEPWTRLCRAG